MNGQNHRIGGRNWPAALERAVECWGQPVGVEEARNCWSELVSLAESGTPTLITHKRSAWAVLAPLTELREPQWAVPMHQVTVARVKLSELVRDAHGGTSQVLHRYYKAVAAVITADRAASSSRG